MISRSSFLLGFHKLCLTIFCRLIELTNSMLFSVLLAKPETVGDVKCYRPGYRETISMNDAVTIIHQLEDASDPNGVAHKPTYRPQDNVIFIYDTSKKPSWKDFLSDVNGFWEPSR